MSAQRIRETAIDAIGITKSFFGARVLKSVDFDVNRGEVHGLVGKNGAGKSTLVKILCGAQPPDSGEIRVGGKSYRSLDPRESRKAGIAVVHQNAEMHLDLSVAANVFLGGEPRNRFGIVDHAAIARRTKQLLEELGLAIPVDARLEDLDIALRQQVAIAKAVHEESSILMLDEPTAALNKSQADFLFKLIRDVAAKGMAVVYISHHLDEVLAISDRITILRDGEKVGVVDSKATEKDGLISVIVGRKFESTSRDIAPEVHSEPLLELDGICFLDRLRDVSMTLHKGEIIGLTGLIGSGARSLAELISGIISPTAGAMRLNGASYAPRNVRAAIAKGVVFIPEDMRERGLVMPRSISENITLAALSRVSRYSWLNLKKERENTLQMSERLDLVPRTPETEVRFLSGGNQRKALLGRAIFGQAGVFVLDDPTQGVDVEAQRQIHAHLRTLAEAGSGIIFLSTDLEELIGLADRIMVMRSGSIEKSLSPMGLTPEALLAAIQAQSEVEKAYA